MEWRKNNSCISLAEIGVLVCALGVALLMFSDLMYCPIRSGSGPSCPEVPAPMLYLTMTVLGTGLTLTFVGWVMALSDDARKDTVKKNVRKKNASK